MFICRGIKVRKKKKKNKRMIVHERAVRRERPAACFDFDGTLVKTRSGATFCRDAKDWVWFDPSVPKRLRQLANSESDAPSHRLIIFSNQTVRFKEATVIDALTQAGVLEHTDVYIAYDKSLKKPGRSMYERAFPLRRLLKGANGPLELELARDVRHPVGSFFVGDALGRAGDWSDSDRRFAEACGLPWIGPEEFFGNLSEDSRTTTATGGAAIVPTSTSCQSNPSLSSSKTRSDGQEMVLMVGPQASGKTTFAREVFGADARYVVLHGDDPLHKTEARFLAATKHALTVLNRSVVVDATNGTRAKRAKFVTVARKAGDVRVRCVVVTTPIDECRRRNALRSSGRVPPVVYAVFLKHYVRPSTTEEDIDVVELYSGRHAEHAAIRVTDDNEI
jgi:bifunctional polynucleotide phosphatase/kinase